ncbi:unnamed protein product [Paramecium sonneborni]|uniref:Transmembrane protein n=1 Tax=Paramecium sonneborni TaxID=65129 RepID=A0A8S1R0Q7_9CILI|nr:unnamed protein product [Paramecium sonneborni]
MNNVYQFDRSLQTIDIEGAQPRKKSIQLNKIDSLDIKQSRQLKLQQQSIIDLLIFLDKVLFNKINNMEDEDINMTFIIFVIVLFHKVNIILMDLKRNIIIYKKEKQSS